MDGATGPGGSVILRLSDVVLVVLKVHTELVVSESNTGSCGVDGQRVRHCT